MKPQIESTELVERLKQPIAAQEAEQQSGNTQQNHVNNMLIDQLRDIIKQSTMPKKIEKPKKVKKKKIKRQDLLKEILEGSAPERSPSITPSAPVSNTNLQVSKNVNNRFDVNFDEFGLFDDSHRFGFNFYSDSYQNNLANNVQSSENYKTVEPKIPKVAEDVNITVPKDFFKFKSQEMFDNYIKKFHLKDKDDNITYESVINEEIDLVRYARERNILPPLTPKPDVEVLKILGLPADCNPFNDTSDSKNKKLSYDSNTNTFRVKHSLLTDEEEKALKKHRNRVASRRFRKLHSKKHNIDEGVIEYEKNLKEIINNIAPEIQHLEGKVKSLMDENRQLSDALKLKYINRLTT